MYEKVQERVRSKPCTWLITGAAGFIGSHLLEALLMLNQRVIGLDNFSVGHRGNLADVKEAVGQSRWKNFRFIEGDIRSLDTCRRACSSVNVVLHEAALGSVPRSIADPVGVHDSNITGFLNMLVAARDAGVLRFIYASSSAVYGDHSRLVKTEPETGRPLSPYAVTKCANELYAEIFARCYGFDSIGLRYFNVFGPRQDPDGPYAAVVPKWIAAMINKEPVCINGDGTTSRDFCYVANAVQANLLAAATLNPKAINQVYNVAVHARTSLNELFALLRERLLPFYPHVRRLKPTHRPFRQGDVRHSEADISKARRLLGYRPTHRINQGLDQALDWYRRNLA